MFFLGVRLTEQKLHCTLLLNPKNNNERKNKIVANTLEGVAMVVRWCGQQGVYAEEVHAVVDGTSPYHVRPATSFHDCGATVSLVDPAQVRAHAQTSPNGSKRGALDGLTLALYALATQPPTWQPVPAHVRAFGALIAQRNALSQDRACSQNRWQEADSDGAPVLVERSIRNALAFYNGEIARLEKVIREYINHHPDLKSHAI